MVYFAKIIMSGKIKKMQTTSLFKEKIKKKSWQTNKNQFTFIDLFAGIGGFRIALESLGGKCVFSSEWEEDSQEVYFKNFREIPEGDIKKINEKDVPQHNILCAGFPCQAFSISGKRLGFKDTRGTLFFGIARIVKHIQPEILFLENVKNLTTHNKGKTIQAVLNALNEINYNYYFNVLRSSDYGVPQARERVYIVAFRKDLNIKNFDFPKPIKDIKIVKDILEKNEPIKDVYINRSDIKITKKEENITNPRKPMQIGQINNGGQGERIYSINAAGITLSAYGGGAASKTGAYLINGKIRKLTPRECARMQGFPEDFELHPKANIAYKQLGNSVSVPVIKSIFKNMAKTCPEILS